jgi:hypothetical protein
MVEVKAAAEAAREKHTASDTLKLKSRRGFAKGCDTESSRLQGNEALTLRLQTHPILRCLNICLNDSELSVDTETNKSDDAALAGDGDEVSMESLSHSEKVATCTAEKGTSKEVKVLRTMGEH